MSNTNIEDRVLEALLQAVKVLGLTGADKLHFNIWQVILGLAAANAKNDKKVANVMKDLSTETGAYPDNDMLYSLQECLLQKFPGNRISAEFKAKMMSELKEFCEYQGSLYDVYKARDDEMSTGDGGLALRQKKK